MTTLHAMETGIDGLYASAPQTLPFGRDLAARAYLLRREAGNLLIYSASGLEDMGEVSRHYLNHGHEAMFASERVRAPLFVHRADRAAVPGPVRATFSRRHMLDDDFEVIPTPGHTPGATAYLWDTGRHRLLFTGDTVFLKGGEWVTAVLESSDPAAYAESLELMRTLDFDVLVPWIASGEPYYALTDGADARRRLDRLIARVGR
jgi:glyoxylase-like metal-dependent hydrolase (beta-lactamase superfamily II)